MSFKDQINITSYEANRLSKQAALEEEYITRLQLFEKLKQARKDIKKAEKWLNWSNQ